MFSAPTSKAGDASKLDGAWNIKFELGEYMFIKNESRVTAATDGFLELVITTENAVPLAQFPEVHFHSFIVKKL